MMMKYLALINWLICHIINDDDTIVFLGCCSAVSTRILSELLRILIAPATGTWQTREQINKQQRSIRTTSTAENVYRITGYFCGPEIFAFCSKTLNLIFCEFKFMRLIGAAK